MFRRVASVGVLAILVLIGLRIMSVPATAQAPESGETTIRAADGATMVYVPAGEFTMGSKSGEGYLDEHPAHTVKLDAFWIDRTEVTNRQFEQFVKATSYRTDAEKEGTGQVVEYDEGISRPGLDWRHPDDPENGIADRMENPVVQVSWNDAQAYCKWAGARLPTEAEWEKAARGTDGRAYPWGSERPTCERAVMSEHGAGCGQGKRAWPVGSKPAGAGPYGALDMVGNVWEFVADWHAAGYYEKSPAANPQGPEQGAGRGSRGGCWSESREDVLRVTMRGSMEPSERSNADGFRCAMSASEGVTTGSAAPIRVLFIGDEASEYLDLYLPKLAAQSASTAALDLKLLVSPGAAPESWWTTGPSAYPEIEALQAGKGDWDFVVLEHVLGESWPYVADFTDFVPRFDEVIKKSGATTVLLLPWAYRDEKCTTEDYTAVYSKSGAELGARVAPVGPAVERAAHERPDLIEFVDNWNANTAGFYLEMAVLYGTLSGRSPEGLGYRLNDVPAGSDEAGDWQMPAGWALSDADAAYLQKVAWETVQEYAAKP